MTILQIQMLLHYYAIGAPYAEKDQEHATSQAVFEQRKQLVFWQMIVLADTSPSGYRMLPRGECFVRHLKMLPLPEQSWAMP